MGLAMKIYFDPITRGFYQTDLHKRIPDTAIEITDSLRWELIKGMSAGKTISIENGTVTLKDRSFNDQELATEERLWRDFELLKADVELYKVQDCDAKSSTTVSQWREYRKQLRAWPESLGFPNKENRPKAPNHKE